MLKMFRELDKTELAQHDKNLFRVVTQVASLALLRGGEFCSSPKSQRKILRGCDVLVKGALTFDAHGYVATAEKSGSKVVVRVSKPKQKWWIDFVNRVAYDPDNSETICPTRALLKYRRQATMRLGPEDPAFKTANGKTMTLKWLTQLTKRLCDASGVVLLDAAGEPVTVLASSWRAGGVWDHKQAGNTDDVVKAAGGWSSDAHRCYTFVRAMNLKAASSRAVAHSEASASAGTALVVGSFNPASIFDDLNADG
jgi:hypothetical protein